MGAQGALRNEPPHPISGLPAPQSGAKHLGVPGDPCLPSPCPAGCPDSWHGSAGLRCPGPGPPPPSSPASKRGPELPGELEKHWQAAPPPGLGGPGGRGSAAGACCLGGAGPGRGSGGGGPPVSGSGRGLVCQRLPPLAAPAAARRASRRRRPPSPRPGRLPAAQAGVRAVLTTSQVA